MEESASTGKRVKTDPDRTLRSEEERRNINSALEERKMVKDGNKVYFDGHHEGYDLRDE